MKHYLWSSVTFIALALLGSYGYSFEYFKKEIDYWEKKDKPEKEKPQSRREETNQKKVEPKDDEQFSWKRQLDPNDKSLEFFREGNHLPPRAYIELIRNPNDKNIRNWFRLINKKNELNSRLQRKMKDYVSRHKIPDSARKDYLSKANSLTTTGPPVDPRGYRMRLYFHSACPHCRRMLTTMRDLAEKGFFVEIRQIDDNLDARKNIPFPVVAASKEELREKEIRSWPVLLIGDLAAKKVFRINGYQTSGSILNSLRRSN